MTDRELLEHVQNAAKAVANDLNVRLRDGLQPNDTEIAQAVLAALKGNTLVPDDKITVTVSNGVVTLEGKVDWEYQGRAAANAIRDLTGVRGVRNTISWALLWPSLATE